MTTYKELVDELRDVARRSSGEQKVIDLLVFAADVIDNLYNINMDLSGELKRTRDLYKAEKACREEYSAGLAAAIEQIPRWIPVTERLPKEWENVLAYQSAPDGAGLIRDAVYIGSGMWREAEMHTMLILPVTHWMPLPEPPKEET